MSPSLPESSAATPLADVLGTAESAGLDPVLDLNLLRRRCLENETLVGQILKKLTVTVVEEQAQLRSACQAADFTAAARIAHRLKGTAANVEAGPLRQAAEQLEAAARREDASALDEAILLLEIECRRLAESVTRYHAN